jgi:hypothetical protein
LLNIFSREVVIAVRCALNVLHELARFWAVLRNIPRHVVAQPQADCSIAFLANS